MPVVRISLAGLHAVVYVGHPQHTESSEKKEDAAAQGDRGAYYPVDARHQSPPSR